MVSESECNSSYSRIAMFAMTLSNPLRLFENESTADRRDGDDGTVSTRNQGDHVKPSTARPRTAAITGAGSGLGREIALNLAAKGYQVFGTALHDDEVHDLSAAVP